MSEKKKTVTSEEVKEARELTEEELEQVTGGSRKSPAHIASLLIGVSAGVVVQDKLTAK